MKRKRKRARERENENWEKGKRPLFAVHSECCLLTGLSWRFCLLPLRASAVALLIVTTWTAGTPPCCRMLTQRLR